MGSSSIRNHELEQLTFRGTACQEVIITMHKAIALVAIFLVVAPLANGAPMPDDLDRSCSHHNGFGYGPLICCGGWCRASFLGAFRDDLEPMPMPDDGFIRESCLTEPDNARDDLDRSCSHHNGFGYGPLICCGGWCRASFLGAF